MMPRGGGERQKRSQRPCGAPTPPLRRPPPRSGLRKDRNDTTAQAFLRDTKATGLRVRVTNTGMKSFVFEAKLDRQTIRRTIGDVRAWSIDAARTEANRLRVMFDGGTDPREAERQQNTDKALKALAAAAHAVTVGEAWAAYLEARRPHWGERHYRDHLALTKAGGLPAVGVRIAGLPRADHLRAGRITMAAQPAVLGIPDLSAR